MHTLPVVESLIYVCVGQWDETWAIEAILKYDRARKKVQCGSGCGFVVMVAYIIMMSSGEGNPSALWLSSEISGTREKRGGGEMRLGQR